MDITIKNVWRDVRVYDAPEEARLRSRWIANTLRPLSHRWRSLTIDKATFDQVTSFFDALRLVEVPNLETFSVTYTGSILGRTTPFTITAFNNGAPRLRGVSLPERFLKLETQFVQCLTNLRRFYGLDCNLSVGLDESIQYIVNLLHCSPELKIFVVTTSPDAWDPTWDPSSWTSSSAPSDVVVAMQLIDFGSTRQGYLPICYFTCTSNSQPSPTSTNNSRFPPNHLPLQPFSRPVAPWRSTVGWFCMGSTNLLYSKTSLAAGSFG